MEYECLDWQPCQFSNIVGKDDVTCSGTSGAAVLWAVGRGGQKEDRLPSTSISTFNTACRRHCSQDRAVSAYYLRPLGRQGQKARCFFIESKKFDPQKSGSSTIDKDRGRRHDLCLRFFEKVRSFTPFEGRVLDRCRAFDRLVSVDAQLWLWVRTVHDTLYCARSTLRLFYQVLFLEICKYSILYLVEEQMGGNEDRLGNQHLCCAGCTV